MLKTSKKLYLHAPNLHVGGGLTLLQALYSAPKLNIIFEHVDLRALKNLPQAQGERYVVRPTFFSRVAAEVRIWRRVGNDDVLLCLHGLVPLLPSRGEVIVVLQNRLLLNGDNLQGYPLSTRLRLLIERLMLKTLSFRVKKFIVQTPSMAEQAKLFLGPDNAIVVCPFVKKDLIFPNSNPNKRYDYVYIASGEHHKNHAKLLDAWCLLAQQGLRPSLVLTVPYESPISIMVERCKQQWGLNILNVGQLSKGDVLALYNQSGALVYPSTTESLGLPLIEASQRQMPIIAAELDYVRDVVDPVETFDPNSSVSIARAVKRHLGVSVFREPISGPEEFLEEVLR